jgi:hypothetical protein
VGHAATYEYIFSGSVNGIYGAGPSREALGLTFGSPLEYRVLVDSERDGYVVSDSGIQLREDIDRGPGGSEDFFFAQLTYRSYELPGLYYGRTDVYHVAVDVISETFGCDILGRLFADAPLFHIDGCSNVSAWEVGDEVGSNHGWHDASSDEYINFFGSLTLSEKNWVPEPGTFAMLSLGLVLLTMGRRSNSA